MAGINLDCDWKSGYVMDPLKKQRVGYLVNFNGIGLTAALAQDTTVFCPYDGTPKVMTTQTTYTAGPPATVKVVGILSSWNWGGGVGDPIQVSGYVSSENANTLKGLMKGTLTTTKVEQLSWWIPNYDEVNKGWYEEAYAFGTTASSTSGNITGQINAPGKSDIRFHIADEATKVAPNIDINVFRITFEVVPAANSAYNMCFGISTAQSFVKAWGLIVGAEPATALAAGT